MTKVSSASQDERHAMMQSMMDHLFDNMGVAEKKKVIATMFSRLIEGLSTKEVMTQLIAQMMPKGTEAAPNEMHDMMTKMVQGDGEHQRAPMPEMMLKSMMPHCIEMMLPTIAPEKRGEAVSALLSAIVEKGVQGMSQEQAKTYREALVDALLPPTS